MFVHVEVLARDTDRNLDVPPQFVDELVAFLCDHGYEAEAHPDQFGVGIDPVGLAESFGLWVTDHLADDAAVALAALAAKWVRRRREHSVMPKKVKVIYAPDGTVLAEVEVGADDL